MELFLARIISGNLYFKYDRKCYWIKSPTCLEKYMAQIIYEESYKKATKEGLYSDEQILEILKKNNLWNDKKEEEFEKTKKDIDILKEELFKSYFKSETRNKTRKMLDLARHRISELHAEKNQYYFLSCSGYASTARTRYLVGYSLRNMNGKKVYSGNNFMNTRTKILDEAIVFYTENELGEKIYRSLSRSDQWKTIWNTSKYTKDLFGCSSVELTQEQTQLISWSNFYDNISESPECPENEIVADDDALDGWAILQRKKNEASKKQKTADQALGNLPNAKEIFIPVENKEDYDRINAMNDYSANIIKKERFAALNKHGTLAEENMPDSQREIAMIANKMGGPK